MITFPATKSEAPIHHRAGSFSEKIAMPSIAVTMKLVDVFMMDTCVAEVPLERAVVKSDHIYSCELLKPRAGMNMLNEDIPHR
jgi:hypothetical protein